MLRVNVKGLEKLSKDINALIARFPGYAKDATQKALLYVHQEMPDYPPQVPTSYIRQFILFKSITTMQGKADGSLSRVEPRFGSVVGVVGTKLKYAPWVIDKNRQTKSHKSHGWWNLQDVVKGMRAGIHKVYKDELKKFFQRTIR